MNNRVYRFFVFENGCEQFKKEYVFGSNDIEPASPTKGDKWMIDEEVYYVQAVCRSFDVDEDGNYVIEVLLMEVPDYKEWWMD